MEIIWFLGGVVTGAVGHYVFNRLVEAEAIRLNNIKASFKGVNRKQEKAERFNEAVVGAIQLHKSGKKPEEIGVSLLSSYPDVAADVIKELKTLAKTKGGDTFG